MEINGKAKEDFKNWCIKNNHDKVNIRYNSAKEIEKTFNIFQNALIIEWLDSVGVYINIETEFNYVDVKIKECNCDDFCCNEDNCYEDRIPYFTFVIKNYNTSINDIYSSSEFKTRQKAIEKAIEIYNQN